MPGRRSELLHILALALIGFSASVARAHAPVPRALSVARDGAGVALSLPGFGMMVRADASQSFAYACDALLGLPLNIEPPATVRRDDGVLLLGTATGLRAMTAAGCPHTLAEPLPARPVYALALAGDVAWAVAGTGLWRSVDAGEHWEQRGLFVGGEKVSGMLIDPGDSTRLYVSRATSLLAYENAGAALSTYPQDTALTLLRAESARGLWAVRRSPAGQGNRGFDVLRAETAAGPWRALLSVNYFGGLTIDANGVVWVGDEGGGLHRSEDGETFREVDPDLSAALVAAGREGLWVATTASTPSEPLLTQLDASDHAATAARYLDADHMVSCPGIDVAQVCAAGWIEWQRDVLLRKTADAGVATEVDAGAPHEGDASLSSIEPVPAAIEPDEREATGCALGGGAAAGWWLLAIAALGRRRRRR